MKKKAEELVNRFYNFTVDKNENGRTNYLLMSKLQAKKCAVIAVDEIIKECNIWGNDTLEYWEQVKTEINNL
jgi:hypothetical protein